MHCSVVRCTHQQSRPEFQIHTLAHPDSSIKSAEYAHGEESLSRQLVRLRADEDAGMQKHIIKLLQQKTGAQDLNF